jgi:tetratricopeptide (TPR) repeat protein
MPKLDHLREKQLSRTDELRAALRALEERTVKLKSMDSATALLLLQDLDRAQTLFEQLEATGPDLTAERGRFESLQGSLKKGAGPLLKALGGRIALAEHRPRPAPPAARWWWYIDRLVAERQRRRYRRIAITVVSVLVIVGGVVLAFNTILAPPPEIVARVDAENGAFLAIDEGNFQAALEAVEAGLTKVPGEPRLTLFKGVLQENLGQEAEAAATFAQVRAAFGDPVTYLLSRAQLRLRVNQPELAEQDVRAALEIEAELPGAWLILGQTLELQDRAFEAVQAYQRAGALALDQGDNEVVVLSRLALARLGGQ